MDFEQAQAYLYSLRHHSAKYGIDRMRVLSDKIGHPEKKFPCIHVAGTNGKGAVCAMLESIFREAGYKTGLFTSPHLVHVNERIKVNGTEISDEKLTEYISKLRPIADAINSVDPDDHPTFFEIINAVGFLYFSDEGIDIALVETGLGGELDSTNVVSPLMSVITSISHDHTEILGDSIRSIAKAKSGIIKKETPVVIGHLPQEAEEMVRAIASDKNAPVISIKKEYGEDFKDYPATNLVGSFQRVNAALSKLACRVLRETYPVSGETIERALQKVHWPARFEAYQLKNNKTLILDCSHNEEGAQFLRENLKQLVGDLGYKPKIIVGTLGEKHAQALVPEVCEFASELIFVRPPSPRASEPAILQKYIPESFGGKVHTVHLDQIITKEKDLELGSPKETVVATGSIYLAGAILSKIS